MILGSAGSNNDQEPSHTSHNDQQTVYAQRTSLARDRALVRAFQVFEGSGAPCNYVGRHLFGQTCQNTRNAYSADASLALTTDKRCLIERGNLPRFRICYTKLGADGVGKRSFEFDGHVG
jgi:hypothetical protein